MTFYNHQIYKFDGSDHMDFTRYKEKALAIGSMKEDFYKALLNNLPEQDPKTGAYLPNNIKKNKHAWSYLILSLKGPPINIICQAINKPHQAWTMLKNCYKPADMDAYTKLVQEFDQ